MSTATVRKVSLNHMPIDRRRGGTIRLLLSPRSAGSTSGFMGVGCLEPGEWLIEHYHPHSEEFVYVVAGDLEVLGDDEQVVHLTEDDALLIPPGLRHRFVNRGRVTAKVVFHNGPLAPSPELGHVDTEAPIELGPPPQVGGPVQRVGGTR